jgi:hypothetical protein
LSNWPLSIRKGKISLNISLGARGGVAVGLPHRNYSVFKQTPINQWEVKVVEVKSRASEAKGPFPGGKRVGSWGKKKRKKESKRHRISTSGLTFAAQ